jgi:hypothetical protein
MQNRYHRRRDQGSRIWRKRRNREKRGHRIRNMCSRNAPKPAKMPNVDLSLKQHLPLLARIVASVTDALRARPKQEYSQHQAK